MVDRLVVVATLPRSHANQQIWHLFTTIFLFLLRWRPSEKFRLRSDWHYFCWSFLLLFKRILLLMLNHSDQLRIEVHLIIVQLLWFRLASIKTVVVLVEIILVLSVKNIPIFVVINRLYYQALLFDWLWGDVPFLLWVFLVYRRRKYLSGGQNCHFSIIMIIAWHYCIV